MTFVNTLKIRTSLNSIGGWSQDGCIYSHSNKTHVICNCYMNGTIAVITEKEITRYILNSFYQLCLKSYTVTLSILIRFEN